MEILTGFLDAVKGIFYSSGLVNLNWQNYAMRSNRLTLQALTPPGTRFRLSTV